MDQLPQIVITGPDGKLIDLDSLPLPIRQHILEHAAKKFKTQTAPLPTQKEIEELARRTSAYARDPREHSDKGPSPVDEIVIESIRQLSTALEFHRMVIMAMVRDKEEDYLDSRDNRASAFSWVRDEALLNAAIILLQSCLD